jgi:hypothetical protein
MSRFEASFSLFLSPPTRSARRRAASHSYRECLRTATLLPQPRVARLPASSIFFSSSVGASDVLSLGEKLNH